MSPLLDYSIALVCDAAAEPELDSWETLCGDKRTLGGEETGILERKPPSAGIFGAQPLPAAAAAACLFRPRGGVPVCDCHTVRRFGD